MEVGKFFKFSIVEMRNIRSSSTAELRSLKYEGSIAANSLSFEMLVARLDSSPASNKFLQPSDNRTD